MTNKKVSKLNRKQRAYLRQCLYDCEPTGEDLYAIVDAAKDSSIPYFLEGLKANHRCLFKSEDALKLASVAPYLVKLEDASNTVNWYLERVYGNGVGFILKSRESLEELLDFWSKKVETKIPGSEVKGFFRFYDPSILRDYIDILQEEGELESFFGQCSSLTVEDSTPEEIITYRRNVTNNDSFSSERINLVETINNRA